MNLGADGNIWHVGTNYKWGNTLLVAQGGATHANGVSGGGLLSGASARDSKSFTVGAIHSLSKRTSMFGGYQRVTVGEQAATDSTAALNNMLGNRNTWTVGLRHNF